MGEPGFPPLWKPSPLNPTYSKTTIFDGNAAFPISYQTQMSQEVEPPVSDDLFDTETEADPEVEQMLQQAKAFHDQIDAMKSWSHQAFAEVTARAAVLEMGDGDEEDVAELRDVARHLLTVADRIEGGDASRVRQP